MSLTMRITALQTIRDILRIFVVRLNSTAHTNIKLDILNDAKIVSVRSACYNIISKGPVNKKYDRKQGALYEYR